MENPGLGSSRPSTCWFMRVKEEIEKIIPYPIDPSGRFEGE